MKSVLLGLFIVVMSVSFFTAGILLGLHKNQPLPVLGVEATPVPTPLSKYTLDNLIDAKFEPSEIKIAKELEKDTDYTSYEFTYNYKPDFENKKTVSGLINIPNNEIKKYPLVFLIRGYVDQKTYSIGIGTKNAAKYFANNGFVTVSPDFLGYGDSSPQAEDIYEARFQTYTTVLSLLHSLDSIKQWDGKHLFIWAHSNGGQVALTTLSVIDNQIPTTLWAPVTKPFPYSILYYTDESDDGGKYIRHELADFENLYDIEHYSFTNYLERIKSPLQLHQGMADDAVPYEWSNIFVNKMKSLGNDVKYYLYKSSDHNMRPDWNQAIARDLEFFRGYIDN